MTRLVRVGESSWMRKRLDSVTELACAPSKRKLIDCETKARRIECTRVCPDTGECMTIYLKTLTGCTINVHTHTAETIESLKKTICNQTGTPADQQRLIFAGKQLDDNSNLQFYNIQRESTVHMVLRLRGGMLTHESGRRAANAHGTVPLYAQDDDDSSDSNEECEE